MTQNVQQGTTSNLGTKDTYELHGIKFRKSGNNRIVIEVPKNQSEVEFSLGEWNQVLMGLGLDSYLNDPQGFTQTAKR